MLSAGEALSIARECHRANIELKEIEPYIKAKAMEGEYQVTLYPSIPYHPKTIETLSELGYEVFSYLDYDRHHFSYDIIWGEE